MNSKKIGEVNGAFWGMMIDQVLDLEDLSKLMPKSENETVDSDSSTNESENETVEPDSSTNESENDDTDVQIDE
jgi:hypothetical protein